MQKQPILTVPYYLSRAIASTEGFTEVLSNVQGFLCILACGTAVCLRGGFHKGRCHPVNSSRQRRWERRYGVHWLVLCGSNESCVSSKTFGSSSCLRVAGLEYSLRVYACRR